MDFSSISSQLSTNPAIALPVLFIAGVLTSFTPCIYPMIPITVARTPRTAALAKHGTSGAQGGTEFARPSERHHRASGRHPASCKHVFDDRAGLQPESKAAFIPPLQS